MKLVTAAIICSLLVFLSIALFKDLQLLDLARAQFGQITGGLETGNLNQLTTLRRDIWKLAAFCVKEHPWLGVGPELFLNHYYQKYFEMFHTAWNLVRSEPGMPHNIYLEISLDSGIISMLLFISSIILMMKRMWCRLRDKTNISKWELMPLIYLAGMLVMGLGNDSIFNDRRDFGVICWTMMGLTLLSNNCFTEKRIKGA